MSLNEYFAADSIFRMSDDSEGDDNEQISISDRFLSPKGGRVVDGSSRTSIKPYTDSNKIHEGDEEKTGLRNVKGRKGVRHLKYVLKTSDYEKGEHDANDNYTSNTKDSSEINDSSDKLIIEQGGLRIECQEKGIKVLNTGGKRYGKAVSMVVDRSIFTGVQQGIMQKPLLEGRKSRSSSEISEEKKSQNMVWFSAKYNNLFTSKTKSMSMSNICDIDDGSTDKRRFSCFKTFKSKLKEMFSPQRIVLHSEYVMIEENGRHIGGIHASRGSACWLFYRGGCQVALVTHEGAILQHMKISHAIDDLTVDDHDNIYLTCPKTKTVKRINRNRVQGSTFMTLQGYPRGIAYNPSYDEIIVCLNDSSPTASSNDRMANNAVIRFKVQHSSERRDYVTEGLDYKFVAYNKCTELKYLQCPVRVCVSGDGDLLFSDFLQKSIVVFNGKMRFKYSIKGEDLFDPANIYRYPVVCCYDDKTFVFSNRSVNTTPNVVILDSDGSVLRKVYVGDLSGCTIHAAHFDSEGRLLVASDNTVFTFDVQL